ncbi:MAG: hypothetical protein JW891_07015 [Candidatus Lokiarchaeota archaeon]|nr:hypothetical protein [Candidatus Lokiarchaeota archaeon]
MLKKSAFTIKSTLELLFNDSQVRDFSYNSFLPEFQKLQTKRSFVQMEKKENSLFFTIECSDITAFRATISDIIGLGKIISNTVELKEE